MNQDQLKSKMIEGARALSGLSPDSCRLMIREVMGLPEPAAQLWDALSERERRSILLYGQLPGCAARRSWAMMPDQTRAAVRQSIRGMAAWAVKLNAECASLRGVAA